MQARGCSNAGRFASGFAAVCLAWSIPPSGAQTGQGHINRTESNLALVGDHKRQAVRFFKNGDYKGALKHFRVVVQHDPSDVESQDNIGVTLARLGRLEEAARAFLQALEIDARFSMPYYHLGLIFDRMGRTGEAIAKYHEALQLNPAFTQGKHSVKPCSQRAV